MKKHYENRGSFTQVPNVFFDTCELPETAQILFLRLLRYTGHKQGTFAGSMRKLANLVRMSKSTVHRMIKQLEDAKLITVSQTVGVETEREIMKITLLTDHLWAANRPDSVQATPKPAVSQQISKSIQLQTMPYVDYLQTPEWQAKREQALRLAEHRCQICNASGSLQVHHRSYERRGREAMSDLIVLCSKCHDLFHQSSELSQDY